MALHTELPVYREPYKKEMLSTLGMKTGVYILKIEAANTVFTKKLIIE